MSGREEGGGHQISRSREDERDLDRSRAGARSVLPSLLVFGGDSEGSEFGDGGRKMRPGGSSISAALSLAANREITIFLLVENHSMVLLMGRCDYKYARRRG